jgi:hypothetical protein
MTTMESATYIADAFQWSGRSSTNKLVAVVAKNE